MEDNPGSKVAKCKLEGNPPYALKIEWGSGSQKPPHFLDLNSFRPDPRNYMQSNKTYGVTLHYNYEYSQGLERVVPILNYMMIENRKYVNVIG